MQTTSYIALSNQSALQRQMDVVANNIANLSTPGFRGERSLFQQYLAQGKADSPSAFVQDAATYRDTRQGPLSQTGNTLDLAIEGNGYFAVSTGQGQRYTRNGQLTLGADGKLVTKQGNAIVDAGGAPVTLPVGATDITITKDGTITTSAGPAGKLQIVDFAPGQNVQPGADGLYVSTDQPQPKTDGVIRQGMIEQSNVQSVVEMTRMMSISRSYSAATQMVDGENDRIKNAIDHLSKSV